MLGFWFAVAVAVMAVTVLLLARLPKTSRGRRPFMAAMRYGLPVAVIISVAYLLGLLLEFSPLKIGALAYAIFLTFNWMCHRFELEFFEGFRAVVPRWVNLVLFAALIIGAFVFELDGGIRCMMTMFDDGSAGLPPVRIVSLCVVSAVAAPYLLNL